MKKLNVDAIVAELKQRVKSLTALQAFVLLLAFIGVIFVVKFFGLREEWKTVRIEVIGKQWGEDWSEGFPVATAFRPQPWLMRDVQIGDMEYGADGRKIAEVINLEEHGDSKAALFVTANLNVVYNKRTKKYAFKNRSIEVGAEIELLLPEAKIEGQIVDIDVPSGGYEKKTMIVTGRIRNVEPWVFEKITPGDKIVNKAGGHVIAEVLRVKTEPAGSAVFFNDPGHATNLFLEKVERRRDVVLVMRIEVQSFKEGWRFAGNQMVKAGSPLRLSFPEYELQWVEVQDYRDEK